MRQWMSGRLSKTVEGWFKSSRGDKLHTKLYTMEIPTIRLSNGTVVANFSSSHPFYFGDGSILPACSSIRAEKMRVKYTGSIAEKKENIRFSTTMPILSSEAIREIESGYPGIDVVIISQRMMGDIVHMNALGLLSEKFISTFTSKMAKITRIRAANKISNILNYTGWNPVPKEICSASRFTKARLRM